MLPSERELIAVLEDRVRILERVVRELQKRFGPLQ